MKRGIIVFNQEEQEWRLWIGQLSYWLQQGYSFELRIRSRYYQAFLEKDFDWFVTLEKDVRFVLHSKEIYKVRVDLQYYLAIEDPF